MSTVATLSLLLLSLGPFSFTTFATASVPSKWVLTQSPSTCKRSTHCSPGSFCTPDYKIAQLPTNRCLPRRKLNHPCESTLPADLCESGTFCAHSVSASGLICTPLLSLGATCTIDAHCQGSSVCKYGRCSPLGNKGDKCRFNSQCDKEKGLYCNQRSYLNGTCASSVAYGAECNLGFSSDPANCVGVCAAPEDGLPNACIPFQKEGMLCQRDEQCTGDLVCNMYDRARQIGVCVREEQLLKTLGAPCDPAKDLCDAVYDLTCHSSTASNFQPVCHQGVVSTSSSAAYCTPGHALSRCPASAGIPTECRREVRYGRVKKKSFFKCLKRIERVPAGVSCDLHFGTDVLCEEGLNCKRVGGIQLAFGYEGFRPPKFCVRKLLDRGVACESKFKSKCPNGQVCRNGKCANGTYSTKTHSNIGAACGQAYPPCIPGSECSADGVCVKPTRIGGKGDACHETALYKVKCEKDLVCFRAAARRNEMRCQARMKEGGVCEGGNEECADGLLCLVRYVLAAKCFDPRFLKPWGAACDAGGRNNGGCVRMTTGRPLTCAAAEMGTSGTPPSRCMQVASILRRCSRAKNVVCQEGVACDSRYGVCSRGAA